jgi:hypothetical protein
VPHTRSLGKKMGVMEQSLRKLEDGAHTAYSVCYCEG